MLLAVDIGNTNVTLGVFDADKLRATWRIATDLAKEADEYAVLLSDLIALEGIKREEIDRAVLASVVPNLGPVFETALRRQFGVTPLRVEAGVKTGLKILYDDPKEVGPDRIVDAVAALKAHKPPIIVVDVGTATVFDAISREGDYLGGAIAPGISVATDALAQKAAMLRRVDLRPPKHAVGNNTTAALQSGVLFGWADMIEGMIQRFKNEIGDDAWVVATGGWAPLMSELTRAFDHVDQDLTLTGLRLIYEMNSGEEA